MRSRSPIPVQSPLSQRISQVPPGTPRGPRQLPRRPGPIFRDLFYHCISSVDGRGDVQSLRWVLEVSWRRWTTTCSCLQKARGSQRSRKDRGRRCDHSCQPWPAKTQNGQGRFGTSISSVQWSIQAARRVPPFRRKERPSCGPSRLATEMCRTSRVGD